MGRTLRLTGACAQPAPLRRPTRSPDSTDLHTENRSKSHLFAWPRSESLSLAANASSSSPERVEARVARSRERKTIARAARASAACTCEPTVEARGCCARESEEKSAWLSRATRQRCCVRSCLVRLRSRVGQRHTWHTLISHVSPPGQAQNHLKSRRVGRLTIRAIGAAKRAQRAARSVECRAAWWVRGTRGRALETGSAAHAHALVAVSLRSRCALGLTTRQPKLVHSWRA